MKTIKVNTWLPVFSGFYGTLWETDADEEREIDNINYERKEKNLPPISWDDVEWDYERYHQQVCEGITREVGETLKEGGFISRYKFEKLSSPREYNFLNDSIHVEFSLTEENMVSVMLYLRENKEAFTKYIKNTYTSYSGFSSSYSNDVNQWLVDYELFTHSHKLGAVLNFILLNEDKDAELCFYEHMHWNGVFLSVKNFNTLMEVK